MGIILTQKMTKIKFTRDFVKFISLFFIGLGLLAFPKMIFAQKTDTIQQLNEVQIHQRRLSLQNLSPVPIQVLTAQELKRMNSLSVADAIRYFSGVQLKDYGGVGGLKTVNVRSMGTNHTAVFYDGVALSNAQNGQVDLAKFSLDNMEEISLVSGQSANLLQPAMAYASASAIFMKTKKNDVTADKNNMLDLRLQVGDFGLISPSLNYQFKIKDKLWGSVSTAYTNANGKYDFRLTNGVFDTTAVRNNGDVERFRLQAALFGETKYEALWKVQAYSFISEMGLPGAVISNKFDYNQRSWEKNFFVQSSYKQNFNKIELLVNGKVTYDFTRFVDPTYVKIDGILDNRFEERSAYLSAGANYIIDQNWSVSFSSDFLHQDLDANLYRFAYPNRNTFLNVLSTAFKTNRFTLQGNVLSTIVMESIKAFSASSSNCPVFSPTLMFSWQVVSDKQFRLRGFYKDIFRMPTFNDLYYTFIGNIALDPEYTKQYDIGFTYGKFFAKSKFQFIELQGDVYYNQVKNKIIAQPSANLMRWVMFNLDEVEIKGLEINAKTSFGVSRTLNVRLGLNYTFQQAIDVSNRRAENFKNQIPYIPLHSGSLMTKLDYKNWKLNYSFIYTGARYNQKYNSIYNYMQPWYTHDANVGYEYVTKKSRISVDVEVNNFLNQYFEVIPNFPMPGRNYRVTLNYSI